MNATKIKALRGLSRCKFFALYALFVRMNSHLQTRQLRFFGKTTQQFPQLEWKNGWVIRAIIS